VGEAAATGGGVGEGGAGGVGAGGESAGGAAGEAAAGGGGCSCPPSQAVRPVESESATPAASRIDSERRRKHTTIAVPPRLCAINECSGKKVP
ncbi:MAG: hypothetical protein F4Z25_11230, partial [Chloroflexi bacterium]|nr:hypothetical protein [Chloroflexota bacterium]